MIRVLKFNLQVLKMKITVKKSEKNDRNPWIIIHVAINIHISYFFNCCSFISYFKVLNISYYGHQYLLENQFLWISMLSWSTKMNVIGMQFLFTFCHWPQIYASLKLYYSKLLNPPKLITTNINEITICIHINNNL